MKSTVYALDANTISYLLRGEGAVDNHFEQELIKAGNLYVVPYIVVYEVRRWLRDRPTRQLQVFAQEFDALFQTVKSKAEMPMDVWDKAADIYIALKQKGQLIKDADILIAAYCMVNNYTLVTRNKDDFKRIDGLVFVDWFE